MSIIIWQFCQCLIQAPPLPPGDFNIPTIPTIPTITSYITAYRYVELASTPTVPAVHISFDITLLLSSVFFGLLLVFSVIYIGLIADSIFKSLAKKNLATWIEKAEKAERYRDRARQAHNKASALNNSLNTNVHDLMMELERSKAAADYQSSHFQQTIDLLKREVTHLKKSVGKPPQPEVVVKPSLTLREVIRMHSARKADPNGIHARYKALGIELENCQSLRNEALTELSSCQEENARLHRKLNTIRAEKITAEETIERLTKDCAKSNETCGKKFQGDYDSNRAACYWQWTKQHNNRTNIYRKSNKALREERHKSKDLTKQVNRCKAKIDSLKADLNAPRDQIMYHKDAVAKANGPSRAEWDEIESRLHKAEENLAKETDENLVLQTEHKLLSSKYDSLKEDALGLDREVTRLQNELLKALRHSGKRVSTVEAEELTQERRLRMDAEKGRDDALTLNQRGNDYVNQLKAEHSRALVEQANQYRHDLGQQEVNYNNKIQQKESACHERIQLMTNECNQRLAQRDNAHQVVVRGKDEEFRQALEKKDLMYQAAKDDARKESANYNLLLQQKDRALKRAQQNDSEAGKMACDELRRLHEHIANTFGSIKKVYDTADDLYDEATEPPFPGSMNVDENVSLTTEERLEQLCSLFKERNNIIIARDKEISDLKGKLSRRSSAPGNCDHLKKLKELTDQTEKDWEEITTLNFKVEALEREVAEQKEDIGKAQQDLDDLIVGVNKLALALGREEEGDYLAFAQDTLKTLRKILTERVEITAGIQEYWKQFYAWE